MKKLISAFSNALNGFGFMLKNERNFKIHLVALVFVCLLGFYFAIDTLEWLSILLVSALVISLEIINSSIEKLCNKVEPNQDPQIKIIKDTAAAAVFVAAAFAFIIALLIFIPYFFTQE